MESVFTLVKSMVFPDFLKFRLGIFFFLSLLYWSVGSQAAEDAASNAPVPDSKENANPLTKPVGNPATRAYTNVYPLDGVVDSSGAVWVVDRNLPGVWKYESGELKVAVEGSKRIREPLNACRCLAVSPSGTLFVGDTSTREVYERNAEGKLDKTVMGMIGIPVDLAFSQDGTLYIADLEKRAVWRLAKDSQSPEVFLPKANPRGLFVDSQNRLWVVSQNTEQIVRYSESGEATTIVSERKMQFPHQIVVDSTGTAWVSDGYKKCIWKIEDGKQPEVAITSDLLKNPVGLFLVPEAKGETKLGIVDPHAMTVFRASLSGQLESWFEIKK